MKVMIKVKNIFAKEQEIVAEKFLKLPVVQKYEITGKRKDGFFAEVELDDGYGFILYVCVMKDAYPALVKEKTKSLPEKKQDESFIIIAPYISDETAEICETEGIGFFDYAGNCLFCRHSVYLREKGNKNPQPKKRGQSSVFERSSEVSSVILREMFLDISRSWKLMHLAERVNCSIGQVFKVKDFLCRNAWAEMTKDGLKLMQPENILREWSKVYGKTENPAVSCYSLDGAADLEKKLRKMKEYTGMDYYLTGFSGGVRYTPVVRYNRVHVYLESENIKEAMEFLECKEVENGQNLIIFPIEKESCIRSSEEKQGYSVVSPVQIYLDCMQIKGRGEEMAEAVMRKEILK